MTLALLVMILTAAWEYVKAKEKLQMRPLKCSSIILETIKLAKIKISTSILMYAID